MRRVRASFRLTLCSFSRLTPRSFSLTGSLARALRTEGVLILTYLLTHLLTYSLTHLLTYSLARALRTEGM